MTTSNSYRPIQDQPLRTTRQSNAGALPPSTVPSNSVATTTTRNPNSSSKGHGHVDVTVFSLLDLPYDDKAPLGIRLSVCGSSIWTGPPKQRRRGGRTQSKNGNSFRFAASPTTTTTTTTMGSSSAFDYDDGTNISTPVVVPFRLTAPLRDLYGAKLKAEVVYSATDASADAPTTLLCADISLCKFCINRPKDLTVTLKPVTKSAGGNSNVESSSSSTTSSSATAIVPELFDRPPTMTIRLHLQGPYRPQIQTLFQYVRVYLQLIDTVQDQLWDPIYGDIIRPYILPALPVGIGLSALPVVTTIIVVSPLVIGVSILFFPIVLPLLVVIGAGMVSGLGVVAVLCGSTRTGRTMIDDTVMKHDWVQRYVLTSPATQAFLYDTGGDWLPSPVALLRWYVVPEDVWIKLVLSLVVDCLGSCSYLLPVVGESFDGPWAPFQSMLLMAMYKDADQPHLKYVSLAEELLPFTDVLPTATIGWATENMPHLVQEWKDLYHNRSTISSNDVANKENNNNNNIGNERRPATATSPPPVSANKQANQGFRPTPEQKRSILKEMQAHSERLSVQS